MGESSDDVVTFDQLKDEARKALFDLFQNPNTTHEDLISAVRELYNLQ